MGNLHSYLGLISNLIPLSTDYFRRVLQVLLVSGLTLLALNPSPSLAIAELDYEAQMSAMVLPYVSSSGSTRSFVGVDGQNIQFYTLSRPGPLGGIVVVPGRTESWYKWREVIYDLAQKGFGPIYALDHRGQGFSGRLAAAHPFKGHVVKFSHYVDDFSVLMRKFVLPEVGSAPLFLLAHSMGGAISGLYMQKNPGVFTAAVMLTPMFAINIGDRKEWEAEALLSFYCATGKCQEYAPDRGDFKFDKEFKDDLDATTSQVRWEHNETVMRQTPAIQLGGPTNGWVLQSLWATKGLRRNADRLRDPLLVFSAGLDLTVENDAIEQVCFAAANCEWVHFPAAKHQVHHESDIMRDDAFQQIYDFFLQYQ